jgi:gamma-glutamylputrescine oxidase
MLTPGIGQNLAGLVRKFGAETARAMYRCSLDAVQYVGALAEREGFDAGLRMSGQLVVAHGRSGRRRLADQALLMESLDLPCERLNDAALQGCLRIGLDAEGGDASGPAALRFPVAGTLHPGRLLAGLAEAVTKRGGRIIEGAKVLSVSTGSPALVRLTDGLDVQAEHVVVATSGYSAPLNPQRGRLVPLHLRVLLSEPLTPSQLGALTWRNREGVIDSRRVFNYFRLTDDDRILFGGGRPRYFWNGQRADPPAEGADLDRLVQAFRRRFPSLSDLPVARSWTGVIAYTLDNLPVVSRVPGHDRVYFAGGWCGHGIALGVYSGRWVEQLIGSGNAAEPYPWFRPRAPLAPPEPLLWAATRLGTHAMELIDRL